MKRILMVLSLSIPLLCYAKGYKQESDTETDRSKVIKVISYNIWDDLITNTQRKESLAAWLASQDPDVVALQELVDFTDDDLVKFAKMYGHKYVAIQKYNGYPVGLTSKKPIEKIYVQTENMGHGMMHAKTYGLDFIVAHFKPVQWHFRLQEANIVSNYITENGLQNYLFMGDLNSHSPLDFEQLERKVEFRESSNPEYENLRFGNFDYSVQARILATPMEDVHARFVKAEDRTTYPAYNSGYNDAKLAKYLDKRGERIDFIYASPELYKRCRNAYIWNSVETNMLSDHFPIGVDILIE